MNRRCRVLKLFIVLFCLVDLAFATEKISPYFGVGSDAFVFSIDSFSATQESLKYEPNMPGLTRVGLSAYGIGISASTRGTSENLDPAKGETKFSDFQLGYHNKQWGADLYVQNYEGFYLKNSSEVGGTTSYHLYPDLKFNHYGLMGRYAFSNDGFSISGLMTQSDEITKSAGSYFLVGGYREYNFSTENTLVPAPLQGTNPEMDKLRKLVAKTLNIGAGAGKYWVSSNKFYFGGVFDILGTFGLYDYKLTDDEESKDYGTISYSLKIGTGYAGKKWRFGLNSYADVTTLQALDKTYIKPQPMSFLFYVRYVFD